MTRLILRPNLNGVDEIYQWLVDAHVGLSETDSLRLSARLVLLLANHIGDPQVIREAITYAASIREERISQCT